MCASALSDGHGAVWVGRWICSPLRSAQHCRSNESFLGAVIAGEFITLIQHLTLPLYRLCLSNAWTSSKDGGRRCALGSPTQDLTNPP